MKFNLLKKILNETGYLIIKVYGISMLPEFKAGDNIILCPLKKHKLKSGDCILYGCLRHGLVFHRIIQKSAKSKVIVVKGDNSNNSESISISQIIGIYQGFYNENCMNKFISKVYTTNYRKIKLEIYIEKLLLKKIVWRTNAYH